MFSTQLKHACPKLYISHEGHNWKTTYENRIRRLEFVWLGRDPVLVLEAPTDPGWGLNLWSSQAEVKGSPPRMFLWGFSQNVFGLGQCKPVGTADTVSSKWLQPEKTNSLRQTQAKKKKKISSRSLFTNTSSIPFSSVSSDRHIFWSATLLWFIINSKLSNQ